MLLLGKGGLLALLSVWVIADASVIDAAVVAALGTIVNTWLLLRHDQKVARLRDQIRDLQRQLRAKRTATRAGELPARVLDVPPMVEAAREFERGE